MASRADCPVFHVPLPSRSPCILSLAPTRSSRISIPRWIAAACSDAGRYHVGRTVILGFLKRLFGGLKKASKRPEVKLVKVTPGVASDASLVINEPIPIQPTMAPVLSWDEPAPDMVESPHTSGAYMVGLVGEQLYPVPVAALKPGAPISLELEPDNPDDSSAIAAVDGKGRVVGYIAPDSWLREAVYGGGAGFSARVLAVELGSRGFREVVLDVEASEEPLRERHYQPVQPQLI